MDVEITLKEVINNLADMHDIEADKNYPEEKCLACICQEGLQEVIDYIVQQSLSGDADMLDALSLASQIYEAEEQRSVPTYITNTTGTVSYDSKN